MGYPNGWMVYFMENPNLKWMMPGGSPILGTPQMGVAMAVMAMEAMAHVVRWYGINGIWHMAYCFIP